MRVLDNLGVFGSPLSSDSTALNSNSFKVSNIYDCNIIGIQCLNKEDGFLLLNKCFKAINISMNKN